MLACPDTGDRGCRTESGASPDCGYRFLPLSLSILRLYNSTVYNMVYMEPKHEQPL